MQVTFWLLDWVDVGKLLLQGNKISVDYSMGLVSTVQALNKLIVF